MHPELYYLAASPFSHRVWGRAKRLGLLLLLRITSRRLPHPCVQAKWALDHHGVSYTTTQYAINPFYATQLPLHWHDKWTGPITAPILLLPADSSTADGGRCE